MEEKEARRTLEQAEKLRKKIRNSRKKLNTMSTVEQLSKQERVEIRIKEWIKNGRQTEEHNRSNGTM